MSTTVEQSLHEVLPVFGDADFVMSLAPDFMDLRVLRIGMQVGDDIHVRMSMGGKRVDWVSEIVAREDRDDAVWFTDRSSTMPWPLARWEHEHGFVAGPHGTTIVDRARFAVRPRVLGPPVYTMMYLSFRMRGRAYRRRFAAAG